MNDIINLTKILLKNSFSSTSSKKKMFFVYAFVYLYFGGIVYYLSNNILGVLIEVNQPSIFLNILLSGIIGITVFRTVFSAINVLYFSKDVENLLPLPIKTWKLVVSKWNVLIVSQYLLQVPLVIPAVILYGIKLNMSIVFYLYSGIIFLLLPILPIVLICILTSIFVRLFRIAKNKDVTQYVSVIFTIVFVILVQFFGNSTEDITNEELYQMLNKADSISTSFSKGFITANMSLKALVNCDSYKGLLNIVYLALLTIPSYAILAKVFSKTYIVGVTSCMSAGGKKVRKLENKQFTNQSVAKSYIIKEIRNLIRNPIFLMQCILPSLLFPAIIIISFCVNVGESIEEMRVAMQAFFDNTIFMAGCLAISWFVYMFNYISITAVSRDASNSTIMKILPIRYKSQMLYKIIPGIVMNFIPTAIVLIILGFFIKYNIYYIAAIGIISILMSIFINYLCIIIDLKNPKLNWSSEYTVVKQNFNMFYQFVFVILEIIVIMLLTRIIKNIELYIGIVLLLTICQLVGVKYYIEKNEKKLFQKIF